MQRIHDPKSRIHDPKSRIHDPKSRSPAQRTTTWRSRSPERRSRASPERRSRASPERRFRDSPERRFRASPERRFRASPERRFRASDADPFLQTIESAFKESNPIGNGVYGSVYKISSNKRTYAVKVLEKRQLSNDQYILNKLVSLCTSSVLCYYDYIQGDRKNYLITEYLQDYFTCKEVLIGETERQTKLNSLIERFKGDKGNVIVTMIQGLKAIHKLGVAHGDIKPDNIMIGVVRDKVNVKYIDFGFGCDNNREGMCSNVYGSSEYQLEYATSDLHNKQMNDRYALAVIIWNLIFRYTDNTENAKWFTAKIHKINYNDVKHLVLTKRADFTRWIGQPAYRQFQQLWDEKTSKYN